MVNHNLVGSWWLIYGYYRVNDMVNDMVNHNLVGSWWLIYGYYMVNDMVNDG